MIPTRRGRSWAGLGVQTDEGDQTSEERAGARGASRGTINLRVLSGVSSNSWEGALAFLLMRCWNSPGPTWGCLVKRMQMQRRTQGVQRRNNSLSNSVAGEGGMAIGDGRWANGAGCQVSSDGGGLGVVGSSIKPEHK
eukprot:1994735-Pyramimonas_sp.AAC.1